MIKKQDILHIAKQFVRHQQGRQARRIVHPRREWAIGVIGFSCIVIVGTIVGWWQYSGSQVENISFVAPGTTRSLSYDSVAAGQLISVFDERRARYDALRANSAALPEPVTVTATTTENEAEAAIASPTAETDIEPTSVVENTAEESEGEENEPENSLVEVEGGEEVVE